MQFEMMRVMAEFALTIQALVKDGWDFTMDYGERRLAVNDRLTAAKGEEKIVCSNIGDVEDLSNVIYREWERQQEWYK